jgi:hypothetical protein
MMAMLALWAACTVATRPPDAAQGQDLRTPAEAAIPTVVGHPSDWSGMDRVVAGSMRAMTKSAPDERALSLRAAALQGPPSM